MAPACRAALHRHKAAGHDLEANVLVPDIDPATGYPSFLHEDQPHKQKLVGTHVRRQAPDVEAADVLLSKARLLQAADSNPAHLAYIHKVLSPNADPQNVPMIVAMVCDPELVDALRQLGHHKEALVLEVMGRAHAAWDCSGLTHAWRNTALARMRSLLCQVLQPHLKHAAPAANSSSIAGLPRGLLVALVGNIDMRHQLLQSFPWLRGVLHERSLPTDDVETEWSTLQARLRYKPELVVAAGCMNNIDCAARWRRSSASTAPMSNSPMGRSVRAGAACR